MVVEQPGSHQPQRVYGGFLTERPGRAEQPRMPGIDLRILRRRVARVEIERDVQPCEFGPERAVHRQIVIERFGTVGAIGKPVHQRAAKAQIGDAARCLACGGVGILHRQCGEALEPVRSAGDLLREEIVGLACQFHRRLAVGNRLDRRGIQATATSSRCRSRPSRATAYRGCRAAARSVRSSSRRAGSPPNEQGLGNREMLFEGDLALHVILRSYRSRARRAGASGSN